MLVVYTDQAAIWKLDSLPYLGTRDNLGGINSKLVGDEFLDLVVVQGGGAAAEGSAGSESRGSGEKKGEGCNAEHG